MNYLGIYQAIIDRSIKRVKPNGYYERHHIIPRSLGGTDDNDNIAFLTVREHYLVHLLLAMAGFDSQLLSCKAIAEDYRNPNRRDIKLKRWVRKRITKYGKTRISERNRSSDLRKTSRRGLPNSVRALISRHNEQWEQDIDDNRGINTNVP